MPSAYLSIASFKNTRRRRLTIKPGASPVITGVLSSSNATSFAYSTASSDVFFDFIISTSFILGTGLKKWRPTSLPGSLSTSDSSVTDREEVLVAKIVSAEHSLSNSLKTSFFSSISSVNTSITRSACSISYRLVVALTLLRISCFNSSLVVLESALSIFINAFLAVSSCLSIMRT